MHLFRRESVSKNATSARAAPKVVPLKGTKFARSKRRASAGVKEHRVSFRAAPIYLTQGGSEEELGMPAIATLPGAVPPPPGAVHSSPGAAHPSAGALHPSLLSSPGATAAAAVPGAGGFLPGADPGTAAAPAAPGFLGSGSSSFSLAASPRMRGPPSPRGAAASPSPRAGRTPSPQPSPRPSQQPSLLNASMSFERARALTISALWKGASAALVAHAVQRARARPALLRVAFFVLRARTGRTDPAAAALGDPVGRKEWDAYLMRMRREQLTLLAENRALMKDVRELKREGGAAAAAARAVGGGRRSRAATGRVAAPATGAADTRPALPAPLSRAFDGLPLIHSLARAVRMRGAVFAAIFALRQNVLFARFSRATADAQARERRAAAEPARRALPLFLALAAAAARRDGPSRAFWKWRCIAARKSAARTGQRAARAAVLQQWQPAAPRPAAAAHLPPPPLPPDWIQKFPFALDTFSLSPYQETVYFKDRIGRVRSAAAAAAAAGGGDAGSASGPVAGGAGVSGVNFHYSYRSPQPDLPEALGRFNQQLLLASQRQGNGRESPG